MDEPALLSHWRHSKTGNLYIVKDIVMMEKTGERFVSYVPADNHLNDPWIRPVREWQEITPYGPRFVRV